MKLMFSLFISIIFSLLPALTQGATVYFSKISGTTYSKVNGWPAITDNAEDMEAALLRAGTSGILVLDGGITYSGTDIDAADLLDTTANTQTVRGAISSDPNYASHNGTVTLSGTGVADSIVSVTHTGFILSGITIANGGDTKYGLISTQGITATSVIFSANDRHLKINAGTSVISKSSFLGATDSSYNMYFENTPVVTFNYCKWTGNVAHGMVVPWSGGTFTFNNCLAWGNGDSGVWGASTSNITVNNSILGGAFTSSTSSLPTIYRTNTATVTVNNSIVLPNAIDGRQLKSSAGVTINNSKNISPSFVSPRRPGVSRKTAIVIDDLSNYSHFKDIADYCTSKGCEVTWALNGPTGFSNWAELKTYTDNGHEVAVHSWTHAQLSSLNAFTIQYVGAGTAATMSRAANTLTTSITGGPGGENLSLDLTNASYDTITELSAYINGLAAYTSSVSSNSGNAISTTLADITSQGIRTASYQALFDSTRFYNQEITSTKSEIDTNIAGYNTTSLVWPLNLYSDAAVTAVKARSMLGARAGDPGSGAGVAGTFSLESINIYEIGGCYAPEFGTNAATIKMAVHAMVARLQYEGGVCVLWGHGSSEYSLVNWRLIIDAVLQEGMEIVSLADLILYAKSLTTDSGDGITWTRTFTDQSDYTFQDNSPSIDIGVGVGQTTDILGNYLFGLPDAGIEEYQPFLLKRKQHK